MADSTTSYVLQESAAGYALYEVVAFEEIGSLLEESSSNVTDYARFGRSVKLKTFLPFQSAEIALKNANAISEHAMTETLKEFLEMNLPKISSKKKKSFSLGVIDTGLATAISEGFDGNLTCRSDDTIREIIRGCRCHLDNYVKGLKGGAIVKAQLGLGHSYSRSKIKFNPARSDNMIIQSIALLDQLDKDVNTFSMRLREWYSYHFPELAALVKDNLMYARTAAYIQNKNSLFSSSANKDDDEDMDDEKKEDKLGKLTEIIGDEDIAKSVINAAKTSMGMECSEVDMINIVNFTQRTVNLAEYRQKLSLYLTEKMGVVAPNLSTLIGDTVAARLISKAGSLMKLAKAPASTVQILGAEKALFRALKTKGNTPKYGLIYHSTFIGRADAKNKGRISRYLANKCSIATRIDTFSDEPTRIYGEKLRDQVEERLKFYETGAAPRKNIDVMTEVAKELKAGKAVDSDDDEEMKEVAEKKTPKSKKKSKKEKKSSSKKKKAEDDDDEDLEDISRNLLETPKSKKEKKEKKSSSKKRKSGDDDDEEPVKEKKSDKKKKKKRKSKGGD